LNQLLSESITPSFHPSSLIPHPLLKGYFFFT
jgi:hypothetical protein